MMSPWSRRYVARSSRPSPLKSPATRASVPTPLSRPGLSRRHRRVDCGLERAVAVAQEHRDIVGVGVGDGQVEMAVAGSRPPRSRRDPPRPRSSTLGWNVPSPLPCRISTGCRR